jgi:hypothetical protein
VAVLAHRSELELTDAQVEALERADAELQQQLERLRAETPLPPAPAGGGRATGHPSGSPGGATGAPPIPGFALGPGGFQMSPGGAGAGGGRHRPAGEPQGGAAAARLDPASAQAALDARLDEADTAAFLRVEPVLTPAQRERARELATRHREQLFERRELLRGR